MNKIKKTLKAFTTRNLLAKFPSEAPHLLKKLSLEPDAVEAQDGLAFMGEFGFEDLWIFHGVAMKDRGGRAIVLAGPAGIGKSTLLRKVAGMGLAEPMDDGFIVAGMIRGQYCILESGLYPAQKTISVLSKWLRMLSGYKSPYLHDECQRDLAGAKRRGEMLHNCAVLIGSIVIRNRSSDRWSSVPVKLTKLFLVESRGDRYTPRRISGEAIESLDAVSVARIFSNYTGCEVSRPCGKEINKALYNRILAELEGPPGCV